MIYPGGSLFPGSAIFPGMTLTDEETTLTTVYPGNSVFPGSTLFPGTSELAADPNDPVDPDEPVTGTLFLTPTRPVYVRLVPGTRLVGQYEQALSVWRTNGVWHQGHMPTDAQISGAERFYSGGHIHSLTSTQRSELIAGGYSAYIIEETS